MLYFALKRVSVRSAKFIPNSFTSIVAKRGYHLHFSCCWLIPKFCFLRITTSLNNVFNILKITFFWIWSSWNSKLSKFNVNLYLSNSNYKSIKVVVEQEKNLTLRPGILKSIDVNAQKYNCFWVVTILCQTFYFSICKNFEILFWGL